MAFIWKKGTAADTESDRVEAEILGKVESLVDTLIEDYRSSRNGEQ